MKVLPSNRQNKEFNRELFNSGIEEAAQFVERLAGNELYHSIELVNIANDIRDLKIKPTDIAGK